MKTFWKQEPYLLDNGLHVEVIKRPGYHTFTCYMAIPVGALATSYAIEGKPTPSGIAHFLEHRLFDMKQGDAFSLFSSLGCDSNAFTTYEYTTYYFETASSLLEGLKVLIEMTTNLTFTKKAVEKEKPIIIEELKMSLDHPYTQLSKGLLEGLIINSPMKDEIVGDEESIKNTTLEDLKRVFNTYYRLDKMRLFIFGDIPSDLLSELSKLKLPSSYPDYKVTRVREKEEESIKSAYQETKMDVPLPLVIAGKKCVDLKDKLHISLEQYEILNEILTNLLFSDSSKLVKEMHDEDLVDVSINGGIMAVDNVDVIYVYASTSKKEKVIEKFKYFLSHLEDYITPRNLKRAIRSCYGTALLSLDSQDFPYQVVSKYMRGISFEKVLQDYETIDYELVKRYIDALKDLSIAVHIVSKGE